jgi:hypothetical protein
LTPLGPRRAEGRDRSPGRARPPGAPQRHRPLAAAGPEQGRRACTRRVAIAMTRALVVARHVYGSALRAVAARAARSLRPRHADDVDALSADAAARGPRALASRPRERNARPDANRARGAACDRQSRAERGFGPTGSVVWRTHVSAPRQGDLP